MLAWRAFTKTLIQRKRKQKTRFGYFWQHNVDGRGPCFCYIFFSRGGPSVDKLRLPISSGLAGSTLHKGTHCKSDLLAGPNVSFGDPEQTTPQGPKQALAVNTPSSHLPSPQKMQVRLGHFGEHVNSGFACRRVSFSPTPNIALLQSVISAVLAEMKQTQTGAFKGLSRPFRSWQGPRSNWPARPRSWGA